MCDFSFYSVSDIVGFLEVVYICLEYRILVIDLFGCMDLELWFLVYSEG